MEKKQYWICDTCGERINDVKDGWLEWIIYEDKRGRRRGRDMRIVHHKRKCMFNSDLEYERDKGCLCDLQLEKFVDSDGLMRLLLKIAQGEIPKKQVLEIIKRLFIPGYEIARLYLEEAIHEGVFQPNTLPGYPFQKQINAVIKWINE